MAADMLAAASRQSNLEGLEGLTRAQAPDPASPGAGLFAEERVSRRPRFAYN